MTRRILPSQKLREIVCDDSKVQRFINSDLRQHVAEVFEQFRGMLEGFFTTSRTDGAATITASADAPSIRLIETDAAADETQWEIQAVSGEFRIVTLDDEGAAGATVISIGRTGTAIDSLLFSYEIEVAVIDGRGLTLNGDTNSGYMTFEHLSSPYADLGSANNVFGSGGTQAIALGTRSTNALQLGTNATIRLAIDGTTGKTSVTAPLTLQGYTVATLPAGTIGDTAYVTNALAPVFGAAVAGGGAVMVPVYYTGAAWFVG